MEEEANPSCLLYSSSQIFSKKRIDFQQNVKSRKQIFQDQFSLFESEEISLPPRQEHADSILQKLLFQFDLFRGQLCTSEEKDRKEKRNYLSEQKVSQIKKILFKNGFLTWNQHKLSLSQILDILKQNQFKQKKLCLSSDQSLKNNQVKKIKTENKNLREKISLNSFFQASDIRGVQQVKQNQRYGKINQSQETEQIENSRLSFDNMIPKKHLRSSSLIIKNKLLSQPQKILKFKESKKQSIKKGNKEVGSIFQKILSASPSEATLQKNQPHNSPLNNYTNRNKMLLKVSNVSMEYLQGKMGKLQIMISYERIKKIKLTRQGIQIFLFLNQPLLLTFLNQENQILLIKQICWWAKSTPVEFDH